MCCRRRRRPLNAAAARSESGSREPFLRLENGPITTEEAAAALCGSAAIVMLMRSMYVHLLIRSHTQGSTDADLLLKSTSVGFFFKSALIARLILLLFSQRLAFICKVVTKPRRKIYCLHPFLVSALSVIHTTNVFTVNT